MDNMVLFFRALLEFQERNSLESFIRGMGVFPKVGNHGRDARPKLFMFFQSKHINRAIPPRHKNMAIVGRKNRFEG